MNKMYSSLAKIIASFAVSSVALAEVAPHSTPEFYNDSGVLRIPLLESYNSSTDHSALYSADLQLRSDGTWDAKHLQKFESATETTQDKGFDPALAGQLQVFLDKQLTVMKQPNLALLVEIDGKAWRGVAGNRINTEGSTTKRAFNDNFRVGSITKLFTLNLIMQLIDQGKVSFDDKMDKWFADEPWFAQMPLNDEITVSDLLSHRSRLYNYVHGDKFNEAVANPLVRTYTPDEWLEIAFNAPASATHGEVGLTPGNRGETFSYTNTGYILLGLIIEKEFKTSYESAVRKHVLDSLRLANTLVPTDPGMIYPYVHGLELDIRKDATEKKPAVITYLYPSIGWSAGSVVANPSDLNRFIKAHVDGVLWSPETNALQLKTLAPANGGASLQNATGAFGLPFPMAEAGYFLRGAAGMAAFFVGPNVMDPDIDADNAIETRLWGHFGQFPGYDTGVYYDPTRKISFVVNAGSFSSDVPEANTGQWVNFNSLELVGILAAYDPDAPVASASRSASSADASGGLNLQWNIPEGKSFADIMETGM